MRILSLFSRGRTWSSGAALSSPVSSTTSSAVTARRDDDVGSIDEDYWSVDEEEAGDGMLLGPLLSPPPVTSDWLSIPDGTQPPDVATRVTAANDATETPPQTPLQTLLPTPLLTSLQTGTLNGHHRPQPPIQQPNTDVTIDSTVQRHATVSIFAHNARQFTCVACDYSASQLAELRDHRRRRHRDISFTDVFHSGCACAASFPSRAAATRHSLECDSAPHTALSTQQQHIADNNTTRGGPTVTRRNPLLDCTMTSNSYRPWRMRARYINRTVENTEQPALLSGCKRRRLDPPPASVMETGEESVTTQSTAFLRRMEAYL